MMRFHLPLFGLLLTAACGLPAAQAAEPCADAEGAWVRAPAPGIKVAAAYLTLHNAGGKECVLRDVSSPQFRKIEIHETLVEDGVASMHRRESLNIAPNGSVELAPNGYHLMLIGGTGKTAVGDNVTLTLKFADDTELHVEAAVRNDAAPVDHMHHHH
jgi:copper(I)-binding protein